jgi:hypothetical protein
MTKITDPNFTLSIIEALSPHEIFATGANKPLLITGVDQNGSKGNYVVKFKCAERMYPEANMRELLALFIAAEMDILSVIPVLVNISAEFVDLLVGQNCWEIANKSIGLNFGSIYIQGYKTILTIEDFNERQLKYAQDLFAFDVFIQNSDRTIKKPNMMTDGNEIVIFDHELAFGFVLDIFQNKQPWIIRDADLEWIKQHCILPKIRGKEFDFQHFSEGLSTLTEDFWERAWFLIPEEWRSLPQFNNIKQYLTAICNNKEVFINHLQQLMS